LKFYSKQKFVSLWYLVAFISTLAVLETATCFACFFVITNNAVQYRSQ